MNKKIIDVKSLSWWRMSLWFALHNLIAHPVSEIMFWLAVAIPIQPVRDRLLAFGDWLHDATVPSHKAEEGRG